MGEKPAIEELHSAYQEALRSFGDAQSAYDQVYRSKTVALNRLNQAQKAFDAAIDAMRESAPGESDWRRSR